MDRFRVEDETDSLLNDLEAGSEDSRYEMDARELVGGPSGLEYWEVLDI